MGRKLSGNVTLFEKFLGKVCYLDAILFFGPRVPALGVQVNKKFFAHLCAFRLCD
jgi:hypothetical protein